MNTREIAPPVAIVLAVIALVAVIGIGLYLINRPTPTRSQMYPSRSQAQQGPGGKTAGPQNAMVGDYAK